MNLTRGEVLGGDLTCTFGKCSVVLGSNFYYEYSPN